MRKRLRYGAEVFHALKSVLNDRGLSTAIGDEGGFAPKLNSAEDALECIAAAVEKAGYKFGEQIFVALDPAASEFYDKKAERLRLQEIRWLEADRRRNWSIYYEALAQRFPIISIEDGCAENDWDGWKKIDRRVSATRFNWSATISSSRTWSFCAKESTKAWPIRFSLK